jgi:predicted RNA binding protein YcfA (HicA-like mRNA interferase family)
MRDNHGGIRLNSLIAAAANRENLGAENGHRASARARLTHIGTANTSISMPSAETNRLKVAARLEREGWQCRPGGAHDVYKHPHRPGRIIVPRHRTLSRGVARAIANAAGWES